MSNSDNDQYRRRPRLPRTSAIPYWVIAIGIAIATIRLFVWKLNQEGIVSEEDGNLVVLVALPVALLMVGWLAPPQNDR